MGQERTPEAPLDLLQAGRDELIDGTGPMQIVSQSAAQAEHLEPGEPHPGRRCAAAQQELASQSAVLRRVTPK